MTLAVYDGGGSRKLSWRFQGRHSERLEIVKTFRDDLRLVRVDESLVGPKECA